MVFILFSEMLFKNKIYKVYGYKGKQVRDNIHSSDLVNMIWEFIKNFQRGIYNVGGGIKNSCSILEAINLIEMLTKRK